MKVAVLGASGHAGSEITKELSRRGHQVTGIARSPDKIPTGETIKPEAGDVNDATAIKALLSDHDAVVSALMFTSANADHMLDLVKGAGVNRYMVVGGAGSLEINGQRLVDSEQFPEEYKPEATHGVTFLERLKQENDLDWTFVSPSIEFTDGPRTGHFRTGSDNPLFNADGKSQISFADFAIAFVDELENPAHIRKRFTVGY